MKKSLRLLAVITVLLCGCATTEVVSKIPFPQLEVYERSEIKVCRERIFIGDGAATIISLDRRPVLRSAAGTCFSAKVAHGTHVLGVMTQSWAGLDMKEFEFALGNGEIKYFVVNFIITIKETTKQEIEKFDAYEQVNVQE